MKDIIDRYKDSWYNEGKIAGMAEGLTDDEKYQQGWHDALEKQGEQKEQTLLNDNNKKYHRVPSTTLKRLYMNEVKYELLKEDITDGYIDTFVKEGSHNYLKIKIPMILCPTNCKKGDKVKLIIVKDK